MDTAAGKITFFTVFFELSDMSRDGFPSLDLTRIFFWESATHIVSTIPLKPTARIVFCVNPSFFFPDMERLAGVHAKKIERFIGTCVGKFSSHKPRSGKFTRAIRHIFSFKNSQSKHLFWSKIRTKIWIEVSSWLGNAFVYVPFLHFVIDANDSCFAFDWHTWDYCLRR